MQFQDIDPLRGSTITFTLRRWVREKRPFLSFIHLAFAGTYRVGCQGAPDAHYMRAILEMSVEIWRSSAMVVDFSALDYQWGDEMDLLLPNEDVRDRALVVGPNCRRALSTLRWGVNTERDITEQGNVFDSGEAALCFLGHGQVVSWNAYVEEMDFLSEADLITLADLDLPDKE